MDRAINKGTGQLVAAFEVFKSGSYQNLSKGEWISPADSITNWEELQKLNILEIPVHYVKEADITYKSGKPGWRAPHFSVYPNSPGKTVQESEEHKKIKNWLFEKLKKDDVEFRYAKGTKPHRYDNKVKLSELPVDWNNYSIEVQTKSMKRLIADILIPFTKTHPLLGNGIMIEIQLSAQSEERTYERSMERALHGYSVTWLSDKDLIIEEDNIQLKNPVIDIFSFSEETFYAGKAFVDDLKTTVEHQCRYLDEKQNCVTKEIIKAEDKLEKDMEFLDEKKQGLYEEIKKQVDGYFAWKSRELSKDMGEKVAQSVQRDFYKNNLSEIAPLIENVITNYIRSINLNLLQENANKIVNENIYPIIKGFENQVRAEINKEMKAYAVWNQFVSNPPVCKGCGSNLMLVRGQYGIFLSCPDYKNGCSQKQPYLSQKMKDDLDPII